MLHQMSSTLTLPAYSCDVGYRTFCRLLLDINHLLTTISLDPTNFSPATTIYVNTPICKFITSTMLLARQTTRLPCYQKNGAAVIPCLRQMRCWAQANKSEEITQVAATHQAGLLAIAALASPLILQVQSALASEGAYGILEGRTAALVHPAVMLSLLASSGYAGYLGWQWRRTREVSNVFCACYVMSLC